MPRPQFRLQSLFIFTAVVGVFCAVAPRAPFVFTAWLAIAIMLAFIINRHS